jgi:hypothetical protein
VEPGLKWKADMPGYELDGGIGGTGIRARAVVDGEGRLVTGMKKSGVVPNQYDLLFLDPAEGSIDMTVEDVGTFCQPAVAEDGTIWAYLNENERTLADPSNPPLVGTATAWLVSIDPATGGILTHYSGDAGSPGVKPCTDGLTFGPDGAVLALENAQGATGTLRSIDPLTGEPNWETVLTDDPEIFAAGERILVAREGSPASSPGAPGTAYVRVRREPSNPTQYAVAKVDLSDGSVDSIVNIPGNHFITGELFVVDPGDGVVIAAGIAASPTVRGHVTRVVDDGAALSVDWTKEIKADAAAGELKDALSGGAVMVMPQPTIEVALREAPKNEGGRLARPSTVDGAAQEEDGLMVAWYRQLDEVVAFRWTDGSVAWHHKPPADRTHEIVVDGNGYIYLSGNLEVLNPSGRRVVHISNSEIPELLNVRGLGPLAEDPAPSAKSLEPSLLYVYSHATTTWLAFEPVHIDSRCYNPGVICGTNEADLLIGTGAGELFIAGRGNDEIDAGGGGDTVLAGGGKDTLLGKGGKDVLKGQGGADKHVGGAGHDKCVGGPGRDTFKSCERKKQ